MHHLEEPSIRPSFGSEHPVVTGGIAPLWLDSENYF